MSDAEQRTRRLAASYGTGGLDALLAMCSEDVVLHIQEDTPNGGRREGKAAFVETMEEFLGTFDDFRLEIVALEENPTATISKARQYATVQGSSIPIEQYFTYVVRFDGELASFIGIYADRDAAEAEFSA